MKRFFVFLTVFCLAVCFAAESSGQSASIPTKKVPLSSSAFFGWDNAYVFESDKDRIFQHAREIYEEKHVRIFIEAVEGAEEQQIKELYADGEKIDICFTVIKNEKRLYIRTAPDMEFDRARYEALFAKNADPQETPGEFDRRVYSIVRMAMDEIERSGQAPQKGIPLIFFVIFVPGALGIVITLFRGWKERKQCNVQLPEKTEGAFRLEELKTLNQRKFPVLVAEPTKTLEQRMEFWGKISRILYFSGIGSAFLCMLWIDLKVSFLTNFFYVLMWIAVVLAMFCCIPLIFYQCQCGVTNKWDLITLLLIILLGGGGSSGRGGKTGGGGSSRKY